MSTYVFEDQAAEAERARLVRLEEWLDPGTLRHLDTIGVEPGWECLEVGAGEGSIARWLCEVVGATGRVVATDLDTRFLDVIDHPSLEVRRHDVVSDPLEEDAFDLIHARLVLEHLPARDDVVRKLVRALRAGGWLLVEDLDGISHVSITPSEVYERVSEAAFSTMENFGFDPHLGRRLYLMLDEAGVEDCYAEGRIAMGTRLGNPGVEMYKMTLGALREAMVVGGGATSEEIDETLLLLDDPSFIAMPPAVIAAWGRKPGPL